MLRTPSPSSLPGESDPPQSDISLLDDLTLSVMPRNASYTSCARTTGCLISNHDRHRLITHDSFPGRITVIHVKTPRQVRTLAVLLVLSESGHRESCVIETPEMGPASSRLRHDAVTEGYTGYGVLVGFTVIHVKDDRQ